VKTTERERRNSEGRKIVTGRFGADVVVDPVPDFGVNGNRIATLPDEMTAKIVELVREYFPYFKRVEEFNWLRVDFIYPPTNGVITWGGRPRVKK